MRPFSLLPLAAFALISLSGCGYHTLGAATHLPPDMHTLSCAVFTTRTEAYHTETVMTDAVIREFATRTRFRVTPDARARTPTRCCMGRFSTRQVGAADLQLLDAAVVQLPHYHGGFSHAERGGTARCSTRTRTTSTAQQYQSTTDLADVLTGEPGGRGAAQPRCLCPAAGGRCAGRVLRSPL
jgi:hypothetical protein